MLNHEAYKKCPKYQIDRIFVSDEIVLVATQNTFFYSLRPNVDRDLHIDRDRRPRCDKAEQEKDRGRAYGAAATVDDDDAGAAMEVRSSPAMDQGGGHREGGR
ncbi:hypothetical protein KCU93_g2, partial [Aureobasidium melanogenum]